MTPEGGADGGRLEPPWHSDFPGSANHELFRGNTKPYNKNVPGYAGQDKGKAPLGSVQRYKKEADAVDEWREEGEEEKRNAGHFAVPPVVYDDTLELPETTPLPEARWGLHPKLLSKKLQSEAAAHTIPQMKGVIGSEVGWDAKWAKYIFYNITKLRVNHNPLPQRTADEEREYQWGLVPEDDFNGVAPTSRRSSPRRSAARSPPMRAPPSSRRSRCRRCSSAPSVRRTRWWRRTRRR
jgi:hypothetical protein